MLSEVEIKTALRCDLSIRSIFINDKLMHLSSFVARLLTKNIDFDLTLSKIKARNLSLITKITCLFISFGFIQFVSAQSYAPPAGQVGSTAIHKDSSVFINWATGCTVTRGYKDISDTTLGYADFGADTNAIGFATGSSVVSLGDRGEAVIIFERPITNGPGPDFAVFENSFSETFLELAFVEVSSDGINFFRFPAVSETQTDTQIGGFGSVDARYLYNLAGKYIANYGTPFDLDDVAGTFGLNENAITHVKIIDVVGSINPQYGSFDSQGNYVNDPFTTPFASSGFDLDAVGVINELVLGLGENFESKIRVYPNPTQNSVNVNTLESGTYSLESINGKQIEQGDFLGNFQLNLSQEKKGIYLLRMITKKGSSVKRIVKK